MINDTIQEIGRAQAKSIIAKRYPYGKFWVLDVTSSYIGIDNSNGNAWTEEFDTSDECIKWLEGEK